MSAEEKQFVRNRARVIIEETTDRELLWAVGFMEAVFYCSNILLRWLFSPQKGRLKPSTPDILRNEKTAQCLRDGLTGSAAHTKAFIVRIFEKSRK